MTSLHDDSRDGQAMEMQSVREMDVAPLDTPKYAPSDLSGRLDCANPNNLSALVETSTVMPHSSPSSRTGDRQAVIICMAGTTIVFISSGTLFAFGVYQDLYESMSTLDDNPFSGRSPAEIGLIGTLGASFMSIGAPYATAWTRQFSPTAVVAGGGLAFGLASVIASFGTQLWHFQLTQGLLFGLGICLAFVPAMTVPPTWYTRRRAFAMGIISSGTGIGGLVWAPAIKALIDTVGFRNALRISGSITGAALALSSCAIRWDPATKVRLLEQRAQEERSWYRQMWDVRLVDWDIAKTRKFAAQVMAGTAQSAAYYTLVLYLSSLARAFGYSATEGANFIAIINACNAISKVCAGFLGDRFGRLHTLFALTVLATISIFGFLLPATLVQSRTAARALYVSFVVGYGIFASPYVALFPASLVDLFGAREFASVNGALYLARGLGTLAGIPIAGLLIRSNSVTADPSAYWGFCVFVGCLFVVTCASTWWIMLEARWAR